MTNPTTRATARMDDDVVLFIIGMRWNKPWHLRTNLRMMAAMQSMMKVLQRDPERGMLHSERALVAGLGPTILQWWRSVEDLEGFLADRSTGHKAGIAWWYRLAGAGDQTSMPSGLWHETYYVRAGDTESLYTNLRPVGLARAGQHVELTPGMATPWAAFAQSHRRPTAAAVGASTG